MTNFMENLWESIFTAGPTPTLLVATNASFAALQVLFFILLIATYSVHFVILSGLTAGLWWAINWFAAEIRAAQAKEEEAKRIRDARREKEKEKKGVNAGQSEGEAMDTGDDTEVDTEVEEKYKPKTASRAPRPETQSTVFVERPTQSGGRGDTPVPRAPAPGPAAASTTGATTKLAPLVDDALKKRRPGSMGESTGELSTDSEWEKLSQDSGER
ncbi:Pkr1-domain-containing protein [Lindgomyces ingoldianus]|uniref:Pkr1-domain-containing protein n=1 Tax=Lindgomyces ingoldianus TaxID=673940 RepID=A0ACB6QJ06_9PLEO|nr:Pkr1-domain-containing protein [Lindgomyces ingoldianus]KAF2466495.1 Pkr1-domain-containing protein [Lindgomyces ingoldianus]